MDANLEKEIVATRLKSVALMQRTKSVLALAELINEFVQLTAIQQKQIAALQDRLKVYEEKSVEPACHPVSGPAPTTAAG